MTPNLDHVRRCPTPRPRLRFGIALAALLAVFPAANTRAQSVPDRMNYQGILLRGDGTPVAAVPTDVEFRIYDTPTLTTGLQWGRMFRITPDSNGAFNVVLSSEGSLLSDAPAVSLASVFTGTGSDARYLELKVKDSTPIRPRQRFVAAPYAFLAHDVTEARRNFTVAGVLTVNGPTTVTTLLTSGAITAGGAVTAGGTVTAPEFVGFGTVPLGGIILWSGTTVPAGWALCDGQNGRPDLRGRFVLGSGSGEGLSPRTLAQKGGLESVTLTTNQMPAHTHGINDPGHTHTIRLDDEAGGGFIDDGGADYYSSTSTGSATTGITILDAGGGQAHENMPPFYVLAYIIRVK